MQVNYSEVAGHVMAHRSFSRRDYAHVRHEKMHPLKEGFQMMASFVVLTASLGVMYFTMLVVSDIQQSDTFSQSRSMTALERPAHALQR
tara:strand:+ start:11374 stop:11640 length:267 start_codon:yes stop_codon:yes gene_type:complete